MVRCTAFDPATETAISDVWGLPVVRASANDPLEAALQAETPTVLMLMPSGRKGQVVMAKFQRKLWAAKPPTTTADSVPAGYAAGGFLGLADELVYEPEPPKKWWQKLLD